VQRKIDAGAVLTRIFATYREYAQVLLTLAVGVALVQAVFRLSDDWVVTLIGSIVSIVVSALFTGAVVELVNDTRDGQLDQSIGALVGQVTPVLLTLIIASLLAGILTILGVIGCFVGAIAVYALLSVTAPVVVVERVGAIDALQRSWRMVWPNFWGVLLVIVVCWLISIVLGALVVGIVGYGVVGAIVAFVIYLLLAPLTALASATLYFELLAAERNPIEPGFPPPPPGPVPPTSPAY
jgi:hypothetical protein